MSNKTQKVVDKLSSLYEAYKDEDKLPFGNGHKYAIFSDLHLGDGLKKADNFFHNEKTLECALNHYKANDYSIILLGDTEEFWQFNPATVIKRYKNTVYNQLKPFLPNKFIRIHGNHDKYWGEPSDPIGIPCDHSHAAPESLMIGDGIFLVHGHQGDKWCDELYWVTKFGNRLIKGFERFLKPFGYENKAATQSMVPKNKEKVYYTWAKGKKTILICGHTHHAMFASRSYYKWLKEQIQILQANKKAVKTKKERKTISKEIKDKKKKRRKEKKRGRDINPLEKKGKPLSCYFNTGCGTYNNGITNIEIEGDKIRLIKWDKIPPATCDKSRNELWDEESLKVLMKEIVNT